MFASSKSLKSLLLMTFLVISSAVISQDTLSVVFRPRLGLGTGTMGYYGEVQSYQHGFTPTVNKFGGTAYLNAPITRFFNLEFKASYSKVAANERLLYRNLNFESRIRMASVHLYYNFWPMINFSKYKFHPFVGVGFSSFEFLSKTDMYDANGNQYHYWSDGSIRDLAENDPMASSANFITRDYTYETDLRELDSEGLGKYKEQSFAVPFTIGAEWHLSPRWDFRIATEWNLTFTDLIDNVTPSGTGVYQGDKNNDRLLFTYVSLSYDLMLPKPEAKGLEPGIEYFADWDTYDWDKDGVIDALDQCPGTPLEALVDSSGCPLDGDEDGVPDYLDDEENTPLGNYVDQYGVTITEEQFERHLKLFYDSTGYEHDFAEVRTEVNIGKPDKTTRKDPLEEFQGKNYVIVVGKEHKDISANELHNFLGFADFKTVVKNDTVYYIMGEYKSIQDAVAAKDELEKMGVQVENISTNNENNNIIKPVDDKVIEKVEKVNKEENVTAPELTLEETIYMVQIGAFKSKVNVEEVFPDVENIFFAKGKDGLYRYYSGKYTSWDEADAHRKEVTVKGHKKAFVVAYKKGERITLIEAGVKKEELPTNYSEDTELASFVEPRGENDGTDNNTDNTNNTENTNNTDSTDSQNTGIINGIDMSKVTYRVELGRFEGEVPIETFNVLASIDKIKPIKEGNTTIYYSKPYSTEQERDAAMEEFETYELENLKPIVEYEGKFYTPEEFKVLLGQ